MWIMTGIDCAGKTTILYQMKTSDFDIEEIQPNIGMRIEIFKQGDLFIRTWDLGGSADKMWAFHKHLYEGCRALIFVVDSVDVERIDEAKDKLDGLLAEEKLRDAVLLVLANKQDRNGMTAAEVQEKLGLKQLKDRTWHIQGCVATEGTGLQEAFDWVRQTLKTRKAELNAR